jgi:hypothetical protein
MTAGGFSPRFAANARPSRAAQISRVIERFPRLSPGKSAARVSRTAAWMLLRTDLSDVAT